MASAAALPACFPKQKKTEKPSLFGLFFKPGMRPQGPRFSGVFWTP